MNEVPKKNGFSMTTGFWFVFNDANTKIVVNGSAMTGKEYVYVNGKLISEKWSFKQKSRHVFSLGDDHYEVLFYASMLTGQVECSLSKNHERVTKYKAPYKHKHISPLLVFGILFFLGFGFGVFTAYNNWSFFGSLLVVLLVTLMGIYHLASNMLIEEIGV